jgi:tetratricopeptide (TPR) repeat protein
MNVSESRSELILDLLSIDGWLPTQNATTLGSNRVKGLSSVVERGHSFRNITAQPHNPTQILSSPRKQGHAKSESFGSAAVKGMVLAVHDTFSTIKRLPVRMEVTAHKDDVDNQSLDHMVNNSVRRIEDTLLTSTDLAQFFNETLWPQNLEAKRPIATPIHYINVEPIPRSLLESTLNVKLAPWHFERLRSPEKNAVFHSSMRQKHQDSTVSALSHQIIDNINQAVQHLPTGMNGGASFPDVPFNILSSKLSDETNEISKLKSTLDTKLESARSLAAAATICEAGSKADKVKKVSKSKKKTTSASAEKNDKSKTKKKSSKQKNKNLGEALEATDKKSEASGENSDEETEYKQTGANRGQEKQVGDEIETGWEGKQDEVSDEVGEVAAEENLVRTATHSEQQRKQLHKKTMVKSLQKQLDGGSDAVVCKSLTNSELLVKLNNAFESAKHISGNVSQLMSAHHALSTAENYLLDLKSRISGLGIVGHAERPLLVAFRQGSYKLSSMKGNLCMILRMFPEAVDMYSRALEFCDWMPEIFFLRAQAYMKKGDIESAQKDLETAKSMVRDGFVEKSENPSLFQIQNDLYMKLAESLSDVIASAQSARSAFDDEETQHGKQPSKPQATAQLRPNNAIILDGSGGNEDWPRSRVFMLASECDSMIHKGLCDEVIKKCDVILGENNAIGLVWALRGRAMLVLGKVEEGLKNINRGVTCWGECYECRLYRALAYRQSDPAAAESDLDMCTQMACCGAIIYVLRASIKESMNRNADAANDWELASRKDATHKNEYRFRACELLFENNQRSDCFHMLDRLKLSSPHYIPAYLLSADLMVRMGNQKGAIVSLSRALILEPWNPLLYFKRAQVLLMKDRSEDSMRDLVMFFRLYGVAKHGFKNDDDANRFQVSMIELHCKALVSLQYWQDIISLLQQNEKLVAESCSLQVKEL